MDDNLVLVIGRAEDAIRSSGLDYTIVRAAFLLNRSPNQRAIRVRQVESTLTLHERIARADVAEALVAAVYHPAASRATFEVTWDRGPRQQALWPELLNGLRPDPRPSIPQDGPNADADAPAPGS